MSHETPHVTEIPQNLAAVEHDPFIDGLDSRSSTEQYAPSAEVANHERAIASLREIATKNALSSEDQQHVVAEQEQRELVHH